MSIDTTGLRRSLSLRLTAMIFILQAIVITIFVLSIHHESHELMVESFDDSLQGNAEALATLVTEDDNANENAIQTIHLDFADEIMRRFSHSDTPDLFAIMLPDRTVIEKSRMMKELPVEVADPEQDREHFDFTFAEKPYRGILLKVKVAPEDQAGKPESLFVFYGTSAWPLLKEQRELVVLLTSMTALCLAVTALLAYLASRLGLYPLRRLAREVSRIREDSLDQRLNSQAVPTELSDISRAINLFLERIEKSFERERRFSTDAAHELRTPIATLKSGVQAALLSPPLPKEVRRTLEDQLIDIERLEQLCNSLLLAVRGCGDASEADLLPATEWIERVRDAVGALSAQAEANGAKVSVEIPSPPEGLRLRCDGFSTARIVTNLVGNAIQYGGEGVAIGLSVRWLPGATILHVEDDGPGIAPHDVPRLFERFYRGDASRSHAGGGFGLGLPICRTLAEAFDGSIDYEAPANGGSRFVWRIRGAAVRGDEA